MEIIYDLDELSVDQIILIRALLQPGSSMPIAGILTDPPTKEGKLQFVEIDADRRVVGFRQKSFADAGILPYDEGIMNTVFRTGLVDPLELYAEYMEAVDEYTSSRGETIHQPRMMSYRA